MSEQLHFRFSSSYQMKNINRVLTGKEKFFLYSAIFILLASIIIWAVNFYFSSTQEMADFGGEYTEGMVGEPIYINPILAQTNEVDAALSQLIFSSLMKFDTKGNLVNDLTDSYDVTEDGTRYNFKLKTGVKWHDKSDLTANDVLFTIKLIQDPAYKSSLRGEWQDIQADVVDDQTITFKINKPYTPFINKLTFGVLPQHVFQQLPADKFLINDFNRKPIGSGPFVVADFKKDSQDNIISYQLTANQEYFNGRPYLDKINFNFYPSEDQLIDAYNKKEINGFGVLSYQKIADFKDRKDSQIADAHTPRYFAIFLNQQKNKALADKSVRQALSFATDRQTIINEVFASYAQMQNSPLLNNFGLFNSSDDIEKYDFNPEKAGQLLDQAGWKMSDDRIRKKDNQELEIALITTQWPDLAKTAEMIKAQWESLGIKVSITNLTVTDIQQNYLKPREYQAILFGQEYYGNDPDPYFFWHSSNKKDPGRNIALYENDKVDELLDKTRQLQNVEERKEKYKEFEKIITEEAPSIFLYSPDYVHITNRKVKGWQLEALVNPTYRFADAQHLYVKTKRIKKDKP